MKFETLEITNICKRFGDVSVLKGIDLQIQPGEFITLVGPSGCGKSTLLRIIAGLESADSGQIGLGDRDLTGIAPRDRDLAMVFQSYALYPHLTVAQNMAVPLVMRRLNGWQRLPFVGGLVPGSKKRGREIHQRVVETASSLEIEQLLDRKPGQLSGGQRQRVALGRAIVREPAAFLMDEPLSNLDAKLRVTMRAEITELHRRLATTFIYVTHDQAEAMTMSSRIAVMLDGELLQVAPPEEVYRRPADIRVAEFIGSPKINLFPCENSHGQSVVLGRSCGLQADGASMIGFRPESVKTSTEGWQGRVLHRESLGPEVFYQLGVEGLAERVIMRVESINDPYHALGSDVIFDLDPRFACAFNSTGKAIATTQLATRLQVAHG